MQSQLLEVPWPQEILNSVNGQEVVDPNGNVIFRGLSVRMGIHWGTPVCEVDPVTKRMDYFGPMVNRASRISSVADGGQITVSSDFIAEIQRLLETHIEGDRSNSTGSEEQYGDDQLSQAIRQELRSLSSQGFEVKDLGERRLKGLENPEYIYLMYPHSLASRLDMQRQLEQKAAQANASGAGQKMPGSQLTIDTENVWDLWNVSLRLEMLCSSLENASSHELKPPETALLERMKNRGGEITDRFLINFVEHQISRIEVCPHIVFGHGIDTNMTHRRAQLPWLSDIWSDLSDKPRSWSKPAPCPTSSASSRSNSPSCNSSKRKQLHSLLLPNHYLRIAMLRYPLPNLRRHAMYTRGSNDVYDHTILSYHTTFYHQP